MPYFGSHLSAAGGWHNAAEAAAALSLDSVQIFTHSPSQWSAGDASLTNAGGTVVTPSGTSWSIRLAIAEEGDRFHAAVRQAKLVLPTVHASYLINLGSADDTLWNRSIAAMVAELKRATTAGCAGVVLHPGACGDSTVEAAIARVATAIDAIHAHVDRDGAHIWLETTAGQGRCLGHRFEELAEIFQRVGEPERLGTCLDTCHVFAAGYPLALEDEYAETMNRFDRLVGISTLRCLHLNDSKKPFGSRVDRHEHLGEGFLGLEPFWRVVNDARLAELPMYLETEKGDRDGEELDAINLRRLKTLLGASRDMLDDLIAATPRTVSLESPSPKRKSAQAATKKAGAASKASPKKTSARKTKTPRSSTRKRGDADA